MHTPTDTVSLFAGPGGMDLAAEALGLHPFGIESDPATCETRIAAGLDTVYGDVRGHSPSQFPNALTLMAGPPCQTFSATGTGTGRRDLDQVLDLVKRTAARENLYVAQVVGLLRVTDPRTLLVLEPLRWALAAADAGRPYRRIVLEQVPAALPVWDAYAAVLRAEGYSVATGVLKTEQHGVPQTRRRAVLIARRDGHPASLPAPTNRPYAKGIPQHEGDPTLEPWVSMGDVLPHRGPFGVVSNYGTGGDPKARGRRTSAEPAFTVTGKISRLRLLGPDGDDLPRLTPAEAGLLQSFPADHPWSGRDVAQQIGNACPPLLARALLNAVGAVALQPAA
ncbi:DNA cytosine methyltransferase [Kitasatospora sp. NBC_00240]|uniref:DNA cytosine methyltransferase n=1 Tax=Kitasatospora sp. NBC_00240 TaxID=2903567 RepID=UPI002257F3BD|nr:DNA cytosine methyltransferase [Kitasatospora sp. NBC_00240]MCX5209734.1 DNA cytosine methyltransferase [Kitasatospora sp. NBC_00240]